MVKLRSGHDTAKHHDTPASHPDTTAEQHTEVSNPSAPFPFLKLPLEIRDQIYRMLLTTPYTYKEARLSNSTDCPFQRTFNLGLDILLANKQISSEASRVLYLENDFAVLKYNPGVNPRITRWKEFMPTLKGLPEGKAVNTVLSITIEPLSKDEIRDRKWTMVITTGEAFPGLIVALWTYAKNHDYFQRMSLALHFHNNIPSRQMVRVNQFLMPWYQVQGFGKVSVQDMTDGSHIKDLEAGIAQRPSPMSVTRHMEEYYVKADVCWKQGDYGGAEVYSSCYIGYWHYNLCLANASRVSSVKLVDDFLVDELQNNWRMMTRAKLLLIKGHLRNSNFRMANIVAEGITRLGTSSDMMFPALGLNYQIIPVLEAKFFLCRSFCCAILGYYPQAAGNMDVAVAALRKSDLYASRQTLDLREELRWGINNSLIKLESRWRCGLQKQTCPKWKGGDDWIVRAGCLSFWDWLNVPEE